MLCTVRKLTGQLFRPFTAVDVSVVLAVYRSCSLIQMSCYDPVQMLYFWPCTDMTGQLLRPGTCFVYWYTDVDGAVVVETHVQMLNVDPDVDWWVTLTQVSQEEEVQVYIPDQEVSPPAVRLAVQRETLEVSVLLWGQIREGARQRAQTERPAQHQGTDPQR